MSRKNKSDLWQYLLLSFLVFLSRVPFIFNGYGLDGDAWSVAIYAKQLHDTGVYEASRLPGYPVHEYLCSYLIPYGAIGLNLLSAFFSAVAVLFFALVLRMLRFRSVLLASAAFAFVPVFFIHSTTAIDYVIALGFIMASMYFLLRNNVIAAGVLLGFAIGARITSGAMLIPFSILLADNLGFKSSSKKIITLIVAALISGCILFLPVLNKYGLGFFTYYNIPYPSVPKVLYKFSFGVWGVLGFAGILISMGLFFLPDRNGNKKSLFPRSVNEKFVISWLVAIDLYIIAFLKLPMESGYLIPIIPFVIFIFAKYLYKEAFVFLCVMIILSSAFCNISPVERFDASSPSKLAFTFHGGGENLLFDVLQGPMVGYNSQRKNGIDFTNELIKATDSVKTKSVLVAGRWFNQLVVQCGDTSRLKISLRSYLSEDEAVYFFAKGYVIYYLPKQDYYNKIMRNVDLSIYQAIPFIKSEEVKFQSQSQP